MPFPQGHGPFIHPAGLSAPARPPTSPPRLGFRAVAPASQPASERAALPTLGTAAASTALGRVAGPGGVGL